MLKKFVFLLLASIFCLVITVSFAAPADLEGYVGAARFQTLAGDVFTYNLVDGQACGVRYQGLSDDVLIPCQLNNYPVATIGDGAFMGYFFINNVIIPDSVVAIGTYAFFECSALTSVIIPESVRFIGEKAFAGCENLVIAVAKNSYAQRYAEENGIPYIFIS